MKKLIVELSKLLPDKIYLQLMYKKHFGYFINFKNPKTYNEKLQWIKIYDRQPEYSLMVDKIDVKGYVSKKVGDKYLIPTLRIWNTAEEIELSNLPERYVLKTNHDSHGIIIIDGKKERSLKEIKAFFAPRLKENGFWYGREWPYKNVNPRVFAEEFIDGGHDKTLRDYKVMCFKGEAKLCEIHIDRFGDNHTQDMYWVDNGRWEKSDIAQGPMSDEVMDRPVFLEEMIRLSEILSSGIRHLRVDWYYTDRLLFGELTFFDGSGFVGFDNPNNDLMIGSWIKM